MDGNEKSKGSKVDELSLRHVEFMVAQRNGKDLDGKVRVRVHHSDQSF